MGQDVFQEFFGCSGLCFVGFWIFYLGNGVDDIAGQLGADGFQYLYLIFVAVDVGVVGGSYLAGAFDYRQKDFADVGLFADFDSAQGL